MQILPQCHALVRQKQLININKHKKPPKDVVSSRATWCLARREDRAPELSMSSMRTIARYPLSRLGGEECTPVPV